MNSSLDKLNKNLPDEDFKYLVEEFDSKHLKMLKQKGDYPYEYMNNFKISVGHISIEDYLLYEKIWNKFKIKNMGDFHDHYLKKDVL